MEVKDSQEVRAKPNEMPECAHHHTELPARLTAGLRNAYFARNGFPFVNQLLFEPEIEFVAVNFNVPVLWLVPSQLTLQRGGRWDIGDRILLHTCLHRHQIRP